MKKSLLLLFVVVICGVMGMWNKGTLAAEDPTDRYIEVFALIQQGDSAEKTSDWSTANSRYNDALEKLRAIKSDSPDWESQMVDFRIKYCNEQIHALKDKVPATPPPAVEAPTPIAVPPPAPPPPEIKAAPAEKQNAELQRAQERIRSLESQLAALQKVQPSKSVVGELDSLRNENQHLNAQLSSAENQNRMLESQAQAGSKQAAENKRLHKDLADASAAVDNYRKAASHANDLQKQNDQLKAELDTLKKQPAAGETNFTGKPEEADVKKLRSDLADAQSEADRARKAAAHADELAKENSYLRTQLATAQKPAPYPAESVDVRKLRSDLADARAEVDRAKKTSEQAAELQRQNKDLSDQLSDTQKKIASQSTDMKRLRSDLTNARMDTDRARNTASSQADDLRRQNKELSAQIATLQKQSAELQKQQAAKSAESADTSRLRSDLNDTRARADQLTKENKDLQSQVNEAKKRTEAQAEDLTKENKDLRAQLAAAEKKAAASPDESAELKKLRSDLADARAEADHARRTDEQAAQLQKQNNDLSAQLTDARSQAGQAKKFSSRVDELTRQNKELSVQLSSAQRQASEMEKQLAAKQAEAKAGNSGVLYQNSGAPAESADIKKLRSDLADARAEIDRTKKNAARAVDEWARENKSLSAQLSDAQRKSAQTDELTKQNKNLRAQLEAAQKPAAPAGESDEVKKLRSDLANAHAEAERAKKGAANAADELAFENKNLSTQLAEAQKKVSQADELTKQNSDLQAKLEAAQKAAPPAGESEEVKKLQSDLSDAQQKAASQADALTKENKDLRDQLAAAQKPAAPAGESDEVKKLQTELSDARTELDHAKQASGQVAQLQKQNNDLSAQLIEAGKKASTESPEVKKLRSDIADAQAEADRAKKASQPVEDLKKQNKALSDKVASLDRQLAAQASATDRSGDTSATPVADASDIMHKLRRENSYLRNILETYSEKDPALKAELRRYGPAP